MVKIGSIAIEEHLIGELAFLWNLRNASVRAPNFRLIDLRRLDERLAAHLDSIALTGQAGWATLALAGRQTGDIGVTFVAVSAALAGGGADQFNQAMEWSGVAEPGAVGFREFVSALARAERNAAATALERLHNRAEPGLQAIWLAAIGARRSDPGDKFDSALAHASPRVRARAYRTAGQLGRADLVAQLRPGLTGDDPECRFWSAWAAARMGARGEALDVLADIAWNNHLRAVRALDLLLRRLDVPQANAWLREFAKLPGRQRDLIRAAGVIGDPLYIPWLIERMAALETARLAGEAFSMITGVDLAYRDLDRKPPQDFGSGPNDDPADENVSLDEDERLPWPDPEKIGRWWTANRGRFNVGTPYFLGAPKPAADWLQALSDAYQRQRHAAALELAIRQPDKAVFEARARGRLQRQLLAGARGKP
jgi:uncharacterized protein (TIGR02270 family)